MKLSIIIPVYYNELNLKPLYKDIEDKILNLVDYECEVIFVDDGSRDNSWNVLCEIINQSKNVKAYRLSRNFGSHSAILCGLEHATGDMAVIKAADLQEPTELILEMVDSWKRGNNVVLALRKEREGEIALGANLYYWLVRKVALSNMPKGGFDVFLLDRKVIEVLSMLDEKNSAVTGQILWSGFKTECIYYTRKERKVGKSKWTLAKKIRLVMDTLFSFSTLPIKLVEIVGFVSFVLAIVLGIIEVIAKIQGRIIISGWTLMFVFQLMSFGIIMLTMGVLGEYMWRTFDASRNRPPYIIEEQI